MLARMSTSPKCPTMTLSASATVGKEEAAANKEAVRGERKGAADVFFCVISQWAL